MGTIAEFVAVNSELVKKSLQIAHSKKRLITVSRVNFNTSVESVGIKENDRVLIHAGSGGVALQSRAIVYTTTSSKKM
jgi:NADPH:quinone reductase-like Zn-dependent oxidoreductase